MLELGDGREVHHGQLYDRRTVRFRQVLGVRLGSEEECRNDDFDEAGRQLFQVHVEERMGQAHTLRDVFEDHIGEHGLVRGKWCLIN